MTTGRPAPATAPTIDAHGARIPALGLGTWELRGDEARRVVERALALGYRHIDTAQAYGNEEAIGRALEEADVARDDVFVTTKVWPDRYRDLRSSVEESLERLRLERVDLLLLHWPCFTEVSLEQAVERLDEARQAGLAVHAGVSNFPVRLLTRAARVADTPLAANQVEYHPFLDQRALLEAVREEGMALIAYTPLAKGRVAQDRTLREIGAAHGKSAAQAALRWLVQQERVAAIPRSSTPEHLAENLAVFDFELTEEEMRRISGLARPGGRIVEPAGLAPIWD